MHDDTTKKCGTEPCSTCVTCSCGPAPKVDEDGLCVGCGGVPLAIAKLCEDGADARPAHVGADVEGDERDRIASIIEDGLPDIDAPPPGPSHLMIDNDDGLRMTLDALTRYLADKPLETLRTLATVLKTLPHSPYLTVSLGTQGKEGIDLLRPLGARSRTFHDSEDRPLTYAILEIDGVEFTATYTEKT